MTLWTFLWRSLRYHLKMHLVVAAGVASATAVLVGALLVGDTVQTSLQNLAQERLGKIDYLVISQSFFREDRIPHLIRNQKQLSQVAGAIVLPHGTLVRSEPRRQLSGVTTLATDHVFWELRAPGTPKPKRIPELDEIVINQTAANQLGAKVGELLTLRLPGSESIPSDSPFGDKEDLVRKLVELTVIEVLPDSGFAQFQLSPNQRPSANAFVAIEAVQDVLEQRHRINAIFIGGPNSVDAADSNAGSESAADEILNGLNLEITDIGLDVQRVPLAVNPSETHTEDAAEFVYDYWAVWSDRMFMSPAANDAAVKAADSEMDIPVMTYLANAIERTTDKSKGRLVPYSLVTAVDFGSAFPLGDQQGKPIGPLQADEIVLTSWLAEQLKAQVGETIRLTYFDPESPHGKLVERAAEFKIQSITPLVQPSEPYLPDRNLRFSQRPSLANDPWLAPPVKGFSDQTTIDDWDVPFTIDHSIVKAVDDEYWEQYATTPKAYLSLESGRRLFGSRFGETTSWRYSHQRWPNQSDLEAKIASAVDWKAAGVLVQPLRAQQMRASVGTTPFGVLFLSLSFFVIVAALLLVGLLFQLGIQQRASSLGLLTSVGFRRTRLIQWFLPESLCVAAVGSVFGIGIGVLYARLVVWLLTTVWVGAITVPFLSFHVSPSSLLIGLFSGVAVCTLTMMWGIRSALRRTALELLRGMLELPSRRSKQRRRWRFIPYLAWALAMVLAAVAATSGGMAQAGSFVGAGFLLLAGWLVWIWMWLHGRPFKVDPLLGSKPFWRWAVRSLTRTPQRSMLTIGLIAASSFLIVSMGAFQMRPSVEGTGGFELIGQSDTPLFGDWPDRMDELYGSRVGVTGPQVFAWRLRSGDEASCTNLYRASQPRIAGVPADFIDAMGNRNQATFRWASVAASERAEQNPWKILDAQARPADAPVPVVLDRNTALYSLQLYRGVGEQFTIEYDGRAIQFEVVGLLADSVLQGMLLIGELDFQRSFSDQSGYRFFLIDAPMGMKAKMAEDLQERFADEGLQLGDTKTLLASLLAVQNTYLQTFQALGSLGLLLGTLGLATVQFRNVLERQRELSVLRAVGFRPGKLAGLVFRENLVLLTVGLSVGIVCAAGAVLPYQWLSGNPIPLGQWVLMLGLVWVGGVLSGLLAVRAVVKLPLLAGLQNE